MARPRRDDELSRIAGIVRGASGWSPLYRWMRERHDTFAALLSEARPDWRALAAEFAAMGLFGGDGQPLGAEGARRTWWRCRRDVKAARASRRRDPVTPAVRLAAPVSPSPPVTPAPADAGDALARLRAEMAQRSGRR